MSTTAKSNLRAALFALGGFAIFATHDALIKQLGSTYSPFQIAFFNVLFGFPFVALIMMRDTRPGTLIPVHPWWSLVRTFATVITGFCAFYAFSVLPLAQAYALLFAMPLLITLLSIPILGEKVGIHRGGAVMVGLIGVMIVLRPANVELGLGHIAGLVAASMGAIASVIMRRIGQEERMVVLLLHPMVATFVVMGCFMPFVYVPLPLGDLGLNFAVALLGFLATLCLIEAYRAGEAVMVAPMQYSQIIWAAIFGYFFFDENIGLATLIGASVIIASGIYIVKREDGATSDNTPVLRARSRFEMGANLRVGAMLRLRRRRDKE